MFNVNNDCQYRFIEHAGLSVLVFPIGTVNETVTQDVVVDAAVAALPVRRRARKSLHAIRGRRAFCKKNIRITIRVTK